MEEEKDSLYGWKKHSGFKKGLLTDIKIGDVNISKDQYHTTMSSDFTPKKLVNEKFAGRSSGFVISDKTQKHIIFGDANLVGADRLESMTEMAFKPPLKANEEENINSTRNETIREMYHCKPITITSAAHNGIQTRQDLPVDLDHFKNFNTTTQDAFCVSDVDLSANRILYGAKPSQLSFGDTSRQTNYNTIHNSSFVGHSVLPHKLQKGQTNKSQILKSDGKTTYEIDKFSHYTTTLSDTFKGVQNTPEQLAYNPIVNQQNGRSHIQFGESNMLQNSVTESVTKRDFIPLSHGFDSHAKKPINTDGMNKSMKPETNLKMKDRSFQEVCYSSGKKANPNPLPSGIQTVCYGRENSGDMLSNKHTYLSSVPEGDANLRLCGTTTQKDFLVHPVIRRKEEYNDKITHSSVFEGTFDSSTDDKYRTTSHIQYRAIDPYLAKLTRGTPVNPYVRMQQLGDGVNYGIDTTHTHHYKNPRQQGRRKPHIPLVAESNKLFPLTKLGLHPYTTTMDEYYGIEKAH